MRFSPEKSSYARGRRGPLKVALITWPDLLSRHFEGL